MLRKCIGIFSFGDKVSLRYLWGEVRDATLQFRVGIDCVVGGELLMIWTFSRPCCVAFHACNIAR